MDGDAPEDLDDEADSDLDLTADDAPVADGPLARGAAVIKAFWKHAPLGPGVYRMLNESGEVLYVGKARSIKKRILSYTAPQRLSNRIARMVSETVSMAFVTVRTEAEVAAARSQPHQAAEAALQRAAARRQELPLHPRHRRPRGAAPRQAPRRARRQGRLLRPVRQRRRRHADALGAAARVPAAHLLRQLLRQPHAALPAVSDQALLRPLHAERSRWPTMRGWSARRASSCPGAAARCATGSRATWAKRPRRWSSSAPPGCATASRRCPPSRASRASIRARRRRRTCSRSTRRPGQFCIEAVFFRAYQNWGNRAFFPRADKSLEPAEVLDAFLAQFYLERPAPRLVLLNLEAPSQATLAEILSERAGRRIAVGVPQARREEGAGRQRRPQRARDAVAQALRDRDAAEAAGRARPDVRPRPRAAPGRGLRQLAHHGHERDRRHDRRRARRLREEPVPHLQHQVRKPDARRRLRDDARGADAPFLAAEARRRDGGGRGVSGHARPRADRRRARPVRRRDARCCTGSASKA